MTPRDELTTLFQWPVAEAGYRWTEEALVDQAGQPERVGRILRPIQGAGEQVREREFLPLRDEPTLFRLFADLDPTEPAILKFATQYGMLTRGRFVVTRESGLIPPGEPFTLWRDEIAAMKAAIGRLKGNERGEKLRWIVNTHLRERVSPQLYVAEPDRPPQLGFGPHHLLGALWLQLGRAIDGEKTYRRCPTCHKLFEVSRERATGKRRQARFDTDVCRVLHWRREKEKQKKKATLTRKRKRGAR
jgi:hypothetical protein